MATRSILATATLVFASLTILPKLFGEQAVSGPARADATASVGIRTDRLTPRQLQTWRSIEQIIQAVDRTGRPLHPRLFSLWQWARTSGHAIYIELIDEKNPQTYHAGYLSVLEPNGKDTSKIAVIQLWCSIIEKASVQKEVRRPDGFIPFDGLGKFERYAQVFGHELVHAQLQLEDSTYDGLCMELDKERTAFLSFRRQNPRSGSYSQSSKNQLRRILSLTEQIEKPAQTAEVEIWQELLEGQTIRAATSSKRTPVLIVRNRRTPGTD
jgi:hypothetical protein